MAEIMYVDWDGLVYYDTRSKQYIKDIVDQTIKFGGNYSIDDVPTPGFDTLHVAYKITNEFVVTPEIDYFVDSCANKHFAEGTIILVVEDNESDTYRFDILFESCSGTSITPDSELDLSNYYTQTEVDNLLTNKVNATELDRYYLKTETDNQLADKADKADLIGLATEEFVNKKISEAELVDKEVDLSNYYNKTETENIVTEAIGNISIPEVPTNVSAFTNDAGYLTEVPNDYVTESILSDYYTKHEIEDKIDTAIDQAIEELNVPGTLSEYATDLELKDAIEAVEYKIITKTSQLENDAGFVTVELLDQRGFITDVSDKANVNHVHSYTELTDTPTIPSINGLATEQYVNDAIAEIDIPTIDTSNLLTKDEVNTILVTKADNVPFTDDYYVGTALGGFLKDDSLKGMTVVQILTKLLGLTLHGSSPGDAAEGSSEVVSKLVTDQVTTYMIGEEGQPVENTFEYRVLTPEKAKVDNQEESFFYQIVSEENGLVESGYQVATVYQENDYLTVYIPEIITKFHVEEYSAIAGDWSTPTWKLVENFTYTMDGYKAYTANAEILSGISIRIVIEN